MKLRHYWLIVCLIIAWIASEGSQEWNKDHSEPSLKECDERSLVLNTCEEQCECNNGKLTSCYRVRKEFTEMTIEERKRYINTYKLASVHPLFKKDYVKNGPSSPQRSRSSSSWHTYNLFPRASVVFGRV